MAAVVMCILESAAGKLGLGSKRDQMENSTHSLSQTSEEDHLNRGLEIILKRKEGAFTDLNLRSELESLLASVKKVEDTKNCLRQRRQ